MRGKTLRLDPIACDGHGVCAELFPERVSLDDWGYPVVDPTPVSGPLLVHAHRAVAHCPALALRLEQVATAVERRLASPAGDAA